MMVATMRNGRLTVWIDGREVLPVRAIPYVAGWEHAYSPDVVAESLARATAAPFEKLQNLVAYHRQAGKPRAMMASEWNGPLAEVKGFEAEWHEQRPEIDPMDDHVGYAAWRKGAALKLPAGVFVWLDEFIRERDADRKRRSDDTPIIFAPRLDSEDTRAAVMEGFEDCPRRAPDADKAMIGYAEFVAICHIDDLKNYGGFRVETDGLYAIVPGAEATLTPEERAELSWHPTGNHDKPALSLPCTLGQLRVFVPAAGMLWHFDEEAVDAMLGETASEQVKTVGGGGDGTAKPKWMTKAWAIGEAWMLDEEKRTKERPGVVAIAKHVEGELSSQNITGQRGRFLDWETIKREALTGITGRKKSENFKRTMGNPQRKKHSPNVKT